MDGYDFWFEAIERDLTPQELVNILAVAQAALEDPVISMLIRAKLGLTRDEQYGLLSILTDMLHVKED